MRKLLKLFASLLPGQRSEGGGGVQVGSMHGGTVNIINNAGPGDERADAERTELLVIMGRLRKGGQRERLQHWMRSELGTAYVKDMSAGQVGRALRYARAMADKEGQRSQQRVGANVHH